MPPEYAKAPYYLQKNIYEWQQSEELAIRCGYQVAPTSTLGMPQKDNLKKVFSCI